MNNELRETLKSLGWSDDLIDAFIDESNKTVHIESSTIINSIKPDSAFFSMFISQKF